MAMGQTLTFWTLAALCAIVTALAWGPPVHAVMDVQRAVLTLLNAAYGPSNAHATGWVTAYDGITYTVRVLDQRQVSTPYGERVYALMGGDAQEDFAGHVTPGIIGAFIGVVHNGSVQAIASVKALPFGWGKAPERFAFQQFGPDAYYGWIIESGYTAQGRTSMSKTLLLPYGKTVSERGSFTTCDADFTLAVDTTAPGVKVYPLLATIQHAGTAREGRTTTVRIPFDAKAFRYRAPEAFSGGC
jgi:hypothetical protein